MNSSTADPCQSGLVSLDNALAHILGTISPLKATEHVSLKAARGRILAADIAAPLNLPPFTNSAMDGYALALTGLKSGMSLKVIGKAMAGQPFGGHVQPGQCVRIFTGAPLPPGTDAVIMQEEVSRRDDIIIPKQLPSHGENVRPAGGDVRRGETVLTRGKQLGAADLGLLASLGVAMVNVYQRPRIGFFSSGDELRPLGGSLPPGTIYESNRYSLHGLLASLPVAATDLGRVADQLDPIIQCLKTAGQTYDVILSSGGASVGEADLLGEALKRAGEMHLWKVAIKPGKPLIFGRIGRAWFFGLPGNPVSVHVTFTQIVRPALWKLAAAPAFQPLRIRARCGNDLPKTPGRLEFQRGRLVQDASGRLTVFGLSGQGSHQLKSLCQANCYIILPAKCTGTKAGDSVWVEPFDCQVLGDD